MIRVARMILLLCLLVATSTFGEEYVAFEYRTNADDFKELDSFSTADAFEDQLGPYLETCLARSGGGSMGARCFLKAQLWERELDIAFKKLSGMLDPEGKEKLRRAQLDWIASRDSTATFNSNVLDKHYDEEGTMWAGPRAGDVDEVFAAILKARTMLLRKWAEQLTQPVSKY